VAVNLIMLMFSVSSCMLDYRGIIDELPQPVNPLL